VNRLESRAPWRSPSRSRLPHPLKRAGTTSGKSNKQRALGHIIKCREHSHYSIPGSTRSGVVPKALHRWLKDYRRGGFDTPLPEDRADRALARTATGGAPMCFAA
jgi:hypothetical protein